MSAIDHLPPAAEIDALPIDELGIRFLSYLLDVYGPGMNNLNPQTDLHKGGELQAWSEVGTLGGCAARRCRMGRATERTAPDLARRSCVPR